MKEKTFKGGIHPYDGKELTKHISVRSIEPGNELIFPMSQHIGAEAVPQVKIGDRVLKGQILGKAEAFVSANIHSSVSGKVIKIEPRLTVGGSKVMSVVVENDGLYEEVDYDSEISSFEEIDKSTIIEKVKAAGVVGLGGACFPTHVKLSVKDPDAIDHVLVNAAECEPYITADYRRLIENPEEVIKGLKIVLMLFKNAKGVIAIENNKPDVIEKMTKLVEKEDRIEVVGLKTKYPQGSEKHIIYAVTGRKINSRKLPADAGCVVDNVDTIYNIYRAVMLNRPLTERIVTVTGDGINKPSNLLVPFGTYHSVLVNEAGGMYEDSEKMISGGPMMGTAMFSLEVPVVKGSSCLLVMKKDPVNASKMTNCLNCGKCVSVCPQGLVCAFIAKAAATNNKEAFIKHYGMECIECGTCNYICPAKRNITQSVRTMKRQIIADRKKNS